MENNDDRWSIVQTFLDQDPKALAREREARTKAEHLELERILMEGPEVPSTIPCLREGCPDTRWTAPTQESVLCRLHTLEVVRGDAKAPPLRRDLDYQYNPGRRIFLGLVGPVYKE